MATNTNYRAIATAAATSSGINTSIFLNQIQAESGFNPDAVSPSGAIGIAQFMPTTAAGIGLNPRDPNASLYAAAKYDANNLKAYNGDYQKMLAAYNAGGGTVNACVSKSGSNWLSCMPAETQDYVAKIMGGKSPQKTQESNSQAPQAQASSTSTILGQVKQWGEYIAIFAIAIALVIVGFMLLASKQTTQLAKKVLT